MSDIIYNIDRFEKEIGYRKHYSSNEGFLYYSPDRERTTSGCYYKELAKYSIKEIADLTKENKEMRELLDEMRTGNFILEHYDNDIDSILDKKTKGDN